MTPRASGLLIAACLFGCGSSSSNPCVVTGGAGTTGAAGHDGGAAGTGAARMDATAAPSPFVLESPIWGDPTVSTAPMLTWLVADGADTYDVEIATKPTFGADDVVTKTGLGATSVVLTALDGLKPGVIYYWRATAVNALGSTLASNAPFVFSSPVAAGPSPHGVAVTPDGTTAVVANDKMAGSVTLLDLATFATQTIAVPGHPGQVAITPDGTRALVTEGTPSDVVMIDLASKAKAGKITPPCVVTTLYGLAIKPDGSAALVPDLGAACTKNVLDVAALPGGAITTSIDLATTTGAFGVAVTPDGATALVTQGSLESSSIKRVDLAGGGALTTIAGTGRSFGVAVTPDGQEALITSGENDTVKRVSLATNTVKGTIDFGSNQDAGNVAVTSDGRFAVVVGRTEVGVLSLADGKVAARYALVGRSVAVTPDAGRALVTGAPVAGKVHVIKLPAP